MSRAWGNGLADWKAPVAGPAIAWCVGLRFREPARAQPRRSWAQWAPPPRLASLAPLARQRRRKPPRLPAARRLRAFSIAEQPPTALGYTRSRAVAARGQPAPTPPPCPHAS